MSESMISPGTLEARGKKRRQSELSDVSSALSERFDVLDNSEEEGDAVTPATPRSSPGKETTRGAKVHACTFQGCDKAFNRPARLEEHLRSHTNTRSFHCSHASCTKTFLRKSHLIHHIKSAHTDIRDYACTWIGCTKRFSTGTRLRRHLAVHEGREKHRCTDFPPCNQTFRKHATLQKHIDIEHLHRKPFRCDRMDTTTGQPCTQGFFTIGKLEAHFARWHDSVQRFWCAECSRKMKDENTGAAGGTANTPGHTVHHEAASFSTLGELRDHMQAAHPPHCPECAMTFSRPAELSRHIDTVHSPATLAERRTHACEQAGCEARFTKRSNLTNHVRTVHAAVKPFVCGTTDLTSSKDTAVAAWDRSLGCAAAFTSKAGLQSHVRTQHLRGPLVRPARNAASRSAPSALARLTGMSYEQEGGAGIACPCAPGCDSVFVTFADVEAHALAKHGMSSDEVAGELAEREALTGGVFWLGGAVHEARHHDEQTLIDPILQYLHAPGLDVPGVQVG